ncbi:MAG: glycosyltransferase family 4 protein [Bacteroidetes bacterium]|nr:glycosyltransferase family 4 protein [Bacteroidota bacterium]MBU1719603.1 glycosyltransferase family 4 protein [Bacteroidota bacterium]
MHIGFFADIRYGSPGGIQQYAERVFKALYDHTDHRITVFTNAKFFENFFTRFPGDSRLQFITTSSSHDAYRKLAYNAVSRNFSSAIIDSNSMMKNVTAVMGNFRTKIDRSGVDVIHFPFQFLPAYRWNIPTVISQHDLQHEYYPEFFSKAEIKNRNTHFRKSALNADHIIVSFDHVKNDIVKFYGQPEQKITVTGLGADTYFEGATLIAESDLRGKFALNERYLFLPAQTWPHKNHLGLLKALLILRERGISDLNLVCTGKKTDYFLKLEQFIQENGLSSQVHFPGFVSINELFSLYHYSSLVVIPTLYEAGSFPLFEAMSLRTPVICSDVTSLPDTIGNASYIFDPLSPDSIANKIMEALQSPDFIAENKENSQIQMNRFVWEMVIPNFISAYYTAIETFDHKKKKS